MHVLSQALHIIQLCDILVPPAPACPQSRMNWQPQLGSLLPSHLPDCNVYACKSFAHMELSGTTCTSSGHLVELMAQEVTHLEGWLRLECLGLVGMRCGQPLPRWCNSSTAAAVGWAAKCCSPIVHMCPRLATAQCSMSFLWLPKAFVALQASGRLHCCASGGMDQGCDK